MINNIYVKIKNFIKNNLKEIIIYLILLLVLTFPLPYFIYVGGGLIDLDDRIKLDSNEKGTYHLAYVKQIRATIPTYLISLVNSKWEKEKISSSTIDDSESALDILKRERLYLEEANNHAIINAYRLSDKEIEIKENYYKIIYVHGSSDTNVKVGDTLLSVNGKSVSSNSEYKEYLKTLKLGEKVSVKVLRDNQEVDCYANLISLNGEVVIGVYLVNIYDIKTNPEIELNFRQNESGPSGGFMLSLAIYDRLVDADLTKGMKIAGTGTIDDIGNVGEIGGVKYKLMGAVNDKADIFFVPKENYEEALSVKKKYNYQIDLVSVSKLEEAISYLENLK